MPKLCPTSQTCSLSPKLLPPLEGSTKDTSSFLEVSKLLWRMVWTPSHTFPEVSSTQWQNLLLSVGFMSSRTPRIRRAGHNCCTNTFITSLGMPSMNFPVRKNNLLLDFPATVLSSSQMKMEAENYHHYDMALRHLPTFSKRTHLISLFEVKPILSTNSQS